MQTPPVKLIALLRSHADQAGFWQPILYAKGQPIETRRDAPPRLVIVEHGLVKLSYLTAEGEEWIKSFIVAEGLFDQIGAKGEPVIEAVCLEPTRAITLSLAWARELAGRNADVQRAVDSFWLWLSAKKRLRESELLYSTPSQRYLVFQMEQATLTARLSQGDIARYLGITPIAFSRIKRRLRAPAYLSSQES